VRRLLNDPDETTTVAITTSEVVAHSDSNDPGMDRRDEAPLSERGIGRTALVLDHEDIHTGDHKTVETMVGSYEEMHRPLHTSVSRWAIIGALRKRLYAIMDHHKEEESVNKIIHHSLRLRIVPVPTQQQHVGASRDLPDNEISSLAVRSSQPSSRIDFYRTTELP
jgi:hypothetical protein